MHDRCRRSFDSVSMDQVDVIAGRAQEAENPADLMLSLPL
jgi:hypothetical protein